VVSVISWSLFNLQDSAFIGLRRVEWVPIDNTAFGVVKIILLFPLVGMFAGYSIFVSWTFPVLLSLVPLQVLLYRKFIPSQMAKATGDEPPIVKRDVARFVAWDYFGWMFAQAAGTLVPLIVVSILGKAANAYYYYPQIIATAIDLFIVNFMTSLVVEASRTPDAIAHYSRLILKRALFFIVPSVAILFLAAPIFFAILPGEYGEESTPVLRLLVISTIPRLVVSLSNSLSRIDQKTHQVAIVQGIQAILVTVMSVVFMHHMGLNGAAVAVLLSTTITALLLLPRLVRRLSPRFAQHS
jgi:O-antigen/teichoic acid export membrane protein